MPEDADPRLAAVAALLRGQLLENAGRAEEALAAAAEARRLAERTLVATLGAQAAIALRRRAACSNASTR